MRRRVSLSQLLPLRAAYGYGFRARVTAVGTLNQLHTSTSMRSLFASDTGPMTNFGEAGIVELTKNNKIAYFGSYGIPTSPTSDIAGPMMKSGAGMVELNDTDKIAYFGGYGIPTSPTQPGASFHKNSLVTDGSGWTNEFHIYNTSDGTWSSPVMTGSRPPPCMEFSFTTVTIDKSKAVVFGGQQPGREMVNDVYIIDFTTMHWTKIEPRVEESWPVGRFGHAACCLHYAGEHTQLLISGGIDNDENVLNDYWLFDLTSRKWKKLTLPDFVQTARCLHSLTPTTLGPGLVEVVVVGEWDSNAKKYTMISRATMRFKFTGEWWELVDVVNNRQGGKEVELREAPAQHSRDELEEALTERERRQQAERKLHVATQEKQLVEEQKQQAERRAELAEQARREAETTIHELRQSVEESERRRLETEERTHDIEQRITELQAIIEDELAPYRLDFQDPLPDSRKVGSGCYGTVYAVEIDGIQCIAKRLQDILIPAQHYDVQGLQRRGIEEKFRRECILMSKIRHPNIVQFMGVRYGRDKYDLTLVMERLPMDLQKCLERCQADKFFIPLSIKFSILVDVTYGLLYLHNRSILHRDLTAGNILLTSNLRAKIADLGVSRIVEARHSQELSTLPGTIGYMPPEALQDKPEYNLKLDVFSFGVLALFVALQQFPAFSWQRVPDCIAVKGETELYKRMQWMSKIGEQHYLYPLIHQCLQDDSKVRPSTMELNAMMKEHSSRFPLKLQDVGAMLTQLNKLGMSDIVVD